SPLPLPPLVIPETVLRYAIVIGMLTGALGVDAASYDPSGWPAVELENMCRAVFLPAEDRGVLGPRTPEVSPRRLYQRYDPLLGGVTFILSDGNGNLDPRPLGTGTIIECEYNRVTPGEDESAMCKLEKGKFTPLPKGSREARTRTVYQVAFRRDWQEAN